MCHAQMDYEALKIPMPFAYLAPRKIAMRIVLNTMKCLLALSFLAFNCICCAPSTTEPDKAASPMIDSAHEASLTYDTMVIDLDAAFLQAKQQDEFFASLGTDALIDSLLSFAAKEGVISYNDDKALFGGYQQMGKYYDHNIPKSLYQKLFPKEEVETSTERIREYSIDETTKTVTLKKGRVVKEERKYKTLYAANDKADYLQLIFTQQGKYCPALSLFTFDKKDFKLIDQVELFGGIYDSYDIDYWHSTFDENHDELSVTSVKNLKFTDIELDTTVVNYYITPKGEILKRR